MQDNEMNGYESSDTESSSVLDKQEEELFFKCTKSPDDPKQTDQLVYHINATLQLKEPATRHYSRGQQSNFQAQDFEALDQSDWKSEPPLGVTPKSSYKFPKTRAFEAKSDYVITLDNTDPDLVYFNSKFECGNLLKATRVLSDTYELVLQHDTNSTVHTQWYFFSVRNVRAGQTVHFKILNFLKPTSLYCEGMQPFVYSLKGSKNTPPPHSEPVSQLSAFEKDLLLLDRQEKLKQSGNKNSSVLSGWARGGFNIHYGRCRSFQEVEKRYGATTTGTTDDDDTRFLGEDTDKPGAGILRKKRKYFSLSFSYTFQHEKDTVFFAHFVPYSYRRLMAHIEKWAGCEKYARLDTLCRSIADNPCPVLTITENVRSFIPRQDMITLLAKSYSTRKWTRKCCDEEESRRKAPVECKDLLLFHKYCRLHRNKRCIFLTSRVHPGESNASFIVEGIIEMLLKSDDPIAKTVRKHYIIVVIPMLNPDGVIYGNYRCSLAGSDLNRQWMRPNKSSHPTIFYAKELLKLMHQLGHTVELFCDIHGHSRRQGLFLYGCTPIGPLTGDKMQQQSEAIQSFAKILATQSPLVTFSNCTFACEKEKEGTGRVVVFKEMGVLNSYTLECSFFGGKQEPPTLFTFKKKGSCVSVRSSSSQMSISELNKEEEEKEKRSSSFFSFNQQILLNVGEDFGRSLYSFYFLKHREQHQFTASLKSPVKPEEVPPPRKSLFRNLKKQRAVSQEISMPESDLGLTPQKQHELSGVLELPVQSSPSKSAQEAKENTEPQSPKQKLSLSPKHCEPLHLRYRSGTLVKEDLLSSPPPSNFRNRALKGADTLLDMILRKERLGSPREAALQKMIEHVTLDTTENVQPAAMAESPFPPKVFAPEQGALSHYWNKVNHPRAIKGTLQVKTSQLYRGTTAATIHRQKPPSRSFMNSDRQPFSKSGRFPARFFNDLISNNPKDNQLRYPRQKPVTPEESARSKKAVELLRVRALMSVQEPQPLFQYTRPFQRSLLPKRLTEIKSKVGKQIRPHRQELTTINIGCVEEATEAANQEKPATPLPHRTSHSKYIRKLAQTTNLRKQRLPYSFNSARETNPAALEPQPPESSHLEFTETLDNLRKKASPRKSSKHIISELQMKRIFGSHAASELRDVTLREGFVPGKKKKQFKY